MFVKRGTILDLLTFDLNNLLEKEEEEKLIEIVNGKIGYVDYKYTINNELGVFDKAYVRIFSPFRSFESNVHTHIRLVNTIHVSTHQLINAAESLIQLYNEDDNGALDISGRELEMIEKRDYWPGRTWNFNDNHELWRLHDDENNFLYSVTIHYDSYEEGFSLSIFGYNKLFL